jgi:hypothetical protein
MKKTYLLALWVLCFNSGLSFANNSESLPSIMASLKSIHETNNEGKVRIELIDEHGMILFQQILFKNQKLPEFDFSALEQGEYIFSIESDIRVVNHPLSIRNDQIIQKPSIEVYKPLIQFKEHRLKVSKFVLDPHEMNIQLIDLRNGKTLYNKTLKKDQSSGIQLNLSRLPKGKYKVLVKNSMIEKEKVVELI